MNKGGRSLELFFVDGDPNGLLTAELFNWTGHVIKAPRIQIKKALSRPESAYTGVYVLMGEEAGKTKAYIGETDNIAKRISQHELGKDWWTDAVLIVSASNNLHKAHATYLEARLIETAKEIGRATLDNSTSGKSTSLSEAASVNMETFLDNLFVILPAIRVDIFEKRIRDISATSSDQGSPLPVHFELLQKKDGIRAKAILQNGEFIVQKGSQLREKWIGVPHASYQSLREELENSQVIGTAGQEMQLLNNYAFSSPSAAAAVVLGRTANGTTEWKHVESGATYKEWEAKQVKSEAE